MLMLNFLRNVLYPLSDKGYKTLHRAQKVKHTVSPLYAYLNPSFCSPLSPSIIPSLFHSKLKTYLFGKSFPP